MYISDRVPERRISVVGSLVWGVLLWYFSTCLSVCFVFYDEGVTRDAFGMSLYNAEANCSPLLACETPNLYRTKYTVQESPSWCWRRRVTRRCNIP